jgi:hypothetical protein
MSELISTSLARVPPVWVALTKLQRPILAVLLGSIFVAASAPMVNYTLLQHLNVDRLSLQRGAGVMWIAATSTWAGSA